MKKITTLLLAGLMAAFIPTGAQSLIPAPGTDSAGPMPRHEAPSKAADNSSQLIFGYCNPEVLSSFGTSPNYEMRMLITLPAEVTETWKGNKITKIRIGLSNNPQIREAYAIITTPEEDGRPHPECLRREKSAVKGGWNELTLTDPLEITGEPLWVGYEIKTVSSYDYPVGCDFVYPDNAYSDHVGILSQMNDGSWAWVWQRVGGTYGSLCIQVVVEGDHLPQNDVKASNLAVNPYNKTNDPFDVSFTIVNNGVSAVTDLTLECAVQGDKVEFDRYVMTPSTLRPGETATVEVKGLKYAKEVFDTQLEVTATRVNGEMDASPLNNKVTAATNFSEIVFPRAFVVEEWTGTWCPWCVRGIVGMEYMRDHYGDKGFIGIAVHSNDEMQTSSYMGFLNKFGGNYPGGTLNRTITFDPNAESMETLFRFYGNQNTIYGISGKAYFEADQQQITVDSKFVAGADLRDQNLSLAVAIIEDQVGPYRQDNAFAGGSSGPMGGWEDKGGSVLWLFDEVAREISKWNGTSSAIPRVLTKNEPVEYSLGVSSKKVSKIKNASAVIMVLNSLSGEILNACLIPISEDGKPDDPGIGDEPGDDPGTGDEPGDEPGTGDEPGDEPGNGDDSKVESVGAGLGVEILGNIISVTDAALRASVYSVDGRNIANLDGVASASLSSGIYIVRVSHSSDSDVETLRIMIK